jgi:hypothetical protein
MNTSPLWRGLEQGLGALLLLVALALHPALAQASPPDPSWIPGIYDDADHDDVVLLLTSDSAAATPAAFATPVPTLPLIGSLAHGLEAAPRAPAGFPVHSRAPPVR